jgi:multisubunit Na+/H+ antiporter MnhB subunit
VVVSGRLAYHMYRTPDGGMVAGYVATEGVVVLRRAPTLDVRLIEGGGIGVAVV